MYWRKLKPNEKTDKPVMVMPTAIGNDRYILIADNGTEVDFVSDEWVPSEEEVSTFKQKKPVKKKALKVTKTRKPVKKAKK
ncbi:MAG: hypothetical protein GY861_16495 [bacterium]|nr:hypothetical protein [bacterium]